MQVLRMMCCTAALAALLAPAASADEFDKLTYLTFSGPVEVPGVTLSAGTYAFRLADPDTSRRVVRVTSKDGRTPYAMFLSMPNERMTASDKPVVMFAERPAGSPEAVKAWFYPGERIGYEFVYPRRQALKIAKATRQPVLSTADDVRKAGEPESVNAVKTAKVERVDEGGAIRETARTPEPEAVVARATPSPRVRALPNTASSMPLFALLSGLLFAAAGATRYVRKQSSAAR